MSADGDEHSVDVAPLRPELERVLARYGLGPDALLLVPSVQEWAQGCGLREDNPFRLASAFPAIGRIVMMSPLPDNFTGTSTRAGPDRHQWVVETDLRAVTYLLLHEIAHLRGIPDERGAHDWAYEELRMIEDNAAPNPRAGTRQ